MPVRATEMASKNEAVFLMESISAKLGFPEGKNIPQRLSV
jgi:hypothetical protein